MLEGEPALLPLSWLKVTDARCTYVKGQNPANFFATYDVVRWDTVWLDKSAERLRCRNIFERLGHMMLPGHLKCRWRKQGLGRSPASGSGSRGAGTLAE
jgi:hypothetical protein